MSIYALWAILIGLSAIANIPCLLYFLKPRKTDSMILAQFQPAIDELNASAAAVAQVVADLRSQVAGAPSAQDVADTQAALQAAADAVKAAAGQ